MSVLSRVAYVVTLAWAIVMGGLVPGLLLSLAYGRILGLIAGVIGASIGFLVHRFAWAE
ncbi:MAG: hypothetical protein JWR52_869 [Marmoricola sp.]|nr:hypothetical protein [Marmoricola sp.]